MKLLKVALLAAVVLAALLLIAGLCMPAEWTVERSIVVRGEPAAVHALVGNLEKWPKWMPWIAEDPAMKFSFAGTAGAPGSSLTWKSAKLGDGALTVISSDLASGLRYDLAMAQLDAPAHGSITYVETQRVEGAPAFGAASKATRVTWKDTGRLGSNPLARLMGPVVESMLGMHFDRGLMNVKSLVEGGT